MAKKVDLNKTLISDKRKSLVIKLVCNKIMATLASKAAFLAAGPLGWLAGIVIKKIVTLVFNHMVLGANDLVISFTVKKKSKKLQKAREKAFVVNKNTTDEELDEIDKEIGDAFSNLIKFRRRKL